MAAVPAAALLGYGSWILSQLENASDALGWDDVADAFGQASDSAEGWDYKNVTDSRIDTDSITDSITDSLKDAISPF